MCNVPWTCTGFGNPLPLTKERKREGDFYKGSGENGGEENVQHIGLVQGGAGKQQLERDENKTKKSQG